jgi:hypothetical protein
MYDLQPNGWVAKHSLSNAASCEQVGLIPAATQRMTYGVMVGWRTVIQQFGRRVQSTPAAGSST